MVLRSSRGAAAIVTPRHPVGKPANSVGITNVLVRAGNRISAPQGIVKEMTSQIETLANQLGASFEGHPNAEILRSLPGLGSVRGARVLAEFGDDPIHYAPLRRS